MMPQEKRKKFLANIPIIVGFLILLYFGGGAFAPALGHAIMVIASLLIMAYLFWVVLPVLNREQEEQRKRAKEQNEEDQQREIRREKNRDKKRR
jgi:large-conductance mechanosensitive channel